MRSRLREKPGKMWIVALRGDSLTRRLISIAASAKVGATPWPTRANTMAVRVFLVYNIGQVPAVSLECDFMKVVEYKVDELVSKADNSRRQFHSTLCTVSPYNRSRMKLSLLGALPSALALPAPES